MKIQNGQNILLKSLNHYNGLRSVGLKIWQSLYLMIWVVMFEFILLMDVIDIPYITELHIVVGAIILILAYYNYSIVSKTEAPPRIKRILRATASFATAQPVLGILMYLDFRLEYSICSSGIIGIVHLIISLAIITQAASVATSYDMWEEKEYVQAPKPPEPEVKKEMV